jgi:hypothetical protein
MTSPPRSGAPGIRDAKAVAMMPSRRAAMARWWYVGGDDASAAPPFMIAETWVQKIGTSLK